MEFSASNRGVTVRIPAGVWEALRTAQATTFDMVGVSDETLQIRAEQDVKKRLTLAASSDDLDQMRAEWQFLSYGPLGLPAQEQVALGLAYLQKERLDQTEMHNRMQALLGGLRDATSPV